MVREISSRTLQMKRAEDLNFERLLLLFRDLDVTKVLVKRLAKTDGPQGQIAGLGKGYEDVPICYVPHSQVEQVIKGGIRPRFNADINYYWMNFLGVVNKAPNAKLIQYTETPNRPPEVRLSAVVSGAQNAPDEIKRRGLDKDEIRLLLIGISKDRLYGYLAVDGSQISHELLTKFPDETRKRAGLKELIGLDLNQVTISHGEIGDKKPAKPSVKTAKQAELSENKEQELVKRFQAYRERSISGDVTRRCHRCRKDDTLLHIHKYKISTGHPLECDIYDHYSDVLYEAKASCDREDVRMAIGQLFDYRRQEDQVNKHRPKLAILLPCRPQEDLVKLCLELEIQIVYEKKNGFEWISP